MSEAARRRWVTVAAVLAALLTGRLGWWQLDRAAQKLAWQGAVNRQAERPVLRADQLATDHASAQAQIHQRAQVAGTWAPQQTIYLDNRQMGGRPGFYVVTPLRLPAGQVILVQRGWLPRDMQDRTRIAPYLTPAGQVTVLGRIAPSPSRIFQLGPDASGAIRQNLDLDVMARESGQRLLPLSLIETATPTNQGDGLARDWPPPAVDVQKHYGYAVQWFALCALILGLYVWFQLIRPRRITPA